MSDDGRPNIVFIVMDTARAQNFSCYGHERDTTPFLDKLAKENTKYENAVTQENWTFPSHASIFSGKYASEHGVTETGSFTSIDSFTEKLSEKGYRTIGLANVAYLSPEFDADDLFDEFSYVPGGSFFENLETDRDDFYSREDYRKYLDLLSDIVKSDQIGKLFSGSTKFFGRKLLLRDSGARKTNKMVKEKLSREEEPFFLFLNYVEPHSPYLPPIPYSHRFLDSKTTTPSVIESKATQDLDYSLGENEPDEEFLEFLKKLYDGEIRYLDSKLKKLYSLIRAKFPNTIFIFTSDHGEMFFENGLFRHKPGGFYKEVKEVPLIEVVPGRDSQVVSGPIELRSLSDHVLSLSDGDFSPLESTGFALSEDIGPEEKVEDNPVRENWGYYGVSVQDEDHKFVWYSSGRKELLKLPNEEKVEDSEKLESMRDYVLDKVGDLEEKDYRRKEINTENEDIKERLEELGYM